MSITYQHRQGENLLDPADAEPLDLTLQQAGLDQYTLGVGQEDHAHIVRGRLDLLTDEHGTRYLRIHEPSEVGHEQHPTMAVGTGLYRVVAQSEYHPLRDREPYRAVQD